MNFSTIDRRTFLQGTAVAGAGLMLGQAALGQSKPDTINIGLLGAGDQGKVLMNAILNIGKNSGIRFQAVCDIWAEQNLKMTAGILKAYGHKATPYTDYKEMLEKETDLDAVIVATPDFWHAEHTIACLKKKLHVYCEKEMSNTLESAKQMVLAARESGKLLQIGHQRRSNPRYRFWYDNIIKEANLLGRITTITGQWNRSRQACLDKEMNPKLKPISDEVLKQYGYESMKQFLNWRWYKGKGGGPIVDLGSHQIDIYAWFLDCQPSSVMASGGVDYWTDHEWYDNVLAIYEFPTKAGVVRASYQTITTNSNGGYYEMFMGDQGTLDISEAAARGSVYREQSVPEADWDKWVKKGYIAKYEAPPVVKKPGEEDVRSSIPAAKYTMPIALDKPFHQPHLENFFDSVRGKAKLNCPGEIGYETAAMVLKVNEAVEKGCKLPFTPEDFKV